MDAYFEEMRPAPDQLHVADRVVAGVAIAQMIAAFFAIAVLL